MSLSVQLTFLEDLKHSSQVKLEHLVTHKHSLILTLTPWKL